MKKTVTNWDQATGYFRQIIDGGSIVKIVFGGSADSEVLRKQCRLFSKDGSLYMQIEKQCANGKVFHENIDPSKAPELLTNILRSEFRQVNVFTCDHEYQLRVIDANKVHFTENHIAGHAPSQVEQSHNHRKNYVFPSDVQTPFLYELGIMDINGRVKQNQYDKFRQINKFMEFIEDAAKRLPGDKTLKVVDFCCGKGYLTFAVYAYLADRCGLDVELFGIDLKEDVINTCSALANKLNYSKMHFIRKDISDFEIEGPADLVISLHACDTATDIVLGKAVKWNTKVILSSPCCHHELSSQMSRDKFSLIARHGILHQRFSEILTDAVRAEILELFDYDVSIVEFIELEHTHKNLLIQAYKRDRHLPEAKFADRMDSLRSTCAYYGIKPSLARLLGVEIDKIQG